jgi:hypothetical protein
MKYSVPVFVVIPVNGDSNLTANTVYNKYDKGMSYFSYHIHLDIVRKTTTILGQSVTPYGI